MPTRPTTAEQRSARQRAIAQNPGEQGQGPAKHGPARQRNPRGQGDRLRDDIIEAASRAGCERVLGITSQCPPVDYRAEVTGAS